MVLFDGREQLEVLGSCLKDACVIFRFAGLFVELRFGSVIAIVAGLLSKLRIHRAVFVGFAFDGELKAARQQGLFVIAAERTGVAEHKLGMEQAEVSKRMLCFLGGGVAEELGEIGSAEFWSRRRSS